MKLSFPWERYETIFSTHAIGKDTLGPIALEEKQRLGSIKLGNATALPVVGYVMLLRPSGVTDFMIVKVFHELSLIH